MKKCSHCQKPLTDFEVLFHQKAQTPPDLSCKCWYCSGAEKDFENAKLGKPSHFLEIIISIVCIVAFTIVIASVFVIDSLSTDDTFITTYTAGVVSLAYIICSFIPSAIIFSRKSKRKTSTDFDPPENRYNLSYGIGKTTYRTKERYDGSFVTEKIVDDGTKLVDNWKLENSKFDDSDSLLDKALNSYSKSLHNSLSSSFNIFAYLFFLVWAIPYIVVVAIDDIRTASYRKNIPHKLRKAYYFAQSNSQKPHITFYDKVGFLISTQKCQKATENQSEFISRFANQTSLSRHPFYYTYKKETDLSYMIVGYRREKNKYYGVTFVLVKNHDGTISKKMITEDGFVSANDKEWATDWQRNGAPQHIISNIFWYEDKFTFIINSHKRKKQIMG